MGDGGDGAPTIAVTLVWSSAPREVREHRLQLPPGSSVAQALAAVSALLPGSQPTGEGDVGIWGRAVPPDQVLQDGDRLELYRPLRVDPKVARRERFQQQGSRRAGLFARKPR